MHSIEYLRIKIEEIDIKIIRLIAQRLKVVQQIGMCKHQLSLPVTNLQRESQLAKLHEQYANQWQVPNEIIQKVFEILIQEGKKTQLLGGHQSSSPILS